MKKQTIPAAQFKSQCLGLLDDIDKGLTAELIVTKRGRPVAKVVPLDRKRDTRKPGGKILGDILEPIDREWIK